MKGTITTTVQFNLYNDRKQVIGYLKGLQGRIIKGKKEPLGVMDMFIIQTMLIIS